jgi:transcriptional regulator with XRE-family HTH domain
MNPSTLSQRLKTALSQRKETANKLERITQVGLAKHCGVSTASVSDWITGKSASMEAENLLKAAEYLHVSAKWLASGHGPMSPSVATHSDRESPTPQNGTDGVTLSHSNTRIPVMFTCEFKAGQWEKPNKFTKEPGKYVDYAIDFGATAFIVVSLGGGLGPSFQNEQAVIVTPCNELSPRGQYVLEQFGSWRLAIFTGEAEYIDGAGNFIDLGNGTPFVCDKSCAILKIRGIVTPDEIKNG